MTGTRVLIHIYAYLGEDVFCRALTNSRDCFKQSHMTNDRKEGGNLPDK
jgi:hypothetical protein